MLMTDWKEKKMLLSSLALGLGRLSGCFWAFVWFEERVSPSDRRVRRVRGDRWPLEMSKKAKLMTDDWKTKQCS
jgi:hypothetical protein